MKTYAQKLFFLIFFFLFFSFFSAVSSDEVLLPFPQNVVLKGFNTEINMDWSIAVDTTSQNDVFTAEELQNHIQENYNMFLPIIDASSAGTDNIVIGNPYQNTYIESIVNQSQI